MYVAGLTCGADLDLKVTGLTCGADLDQKQYSRSDLSVRTWNNVTGLTVPTWT